MLQGDVAPRTAENALPALAFAADETNRTARLTGTPSDSLFLADVAGMTTATVYNHFKTKEEVLREVALRLATTLCTRISESQAGVKEGAERMAIGGRRYVWLAEVAPQWALLLLDVAAATPDLLLHIRQFTLADLRLGVKQKAFRIANEQVAIDLINGAGTNAMRSVALGLAPASHGADMAACVLRGLGVPHEKAEVIARRPLPHDLDPIPAANPSLRAPLLQTSAGSPQDLT